MGGELGCEEAVLDFGGDGVGDRTDEEWDWRLLDCYSLGSAGLSLKKADLRGLSAGREG